MKIQKLLNEKIFAEKILKQICNLITSTAVIYSLTNIYSQSLAVLNFELFWKNVRHLIMYHGLTSLNILQYKAGKLEDKNRNYYSYVNSEGNVFGARLTKIEFKLHPEFFRLKSNIHGQLADDFIRDVKSRYVINGVFLSLETYLKDL